MRLRFWQRQSKKEILASSYKKLVGEEAKANQTKVKKVYTLRFYIMILSGVVSAGGLVLFIIYVNSLNLIFGLPGIIMIAGGIFVLQHYWRQGEGMSIEHLGGAGKSDIANSLNLYPTKVIFENADAPTGFPWSCAGLKGKFYVNIWDVVLNKLVPFVLPDQQYCDPIVFAQRVLGLPAHRKIFERKPKLLQKLKTALLVLAIGIVWLLILTTTGSN